MCVSRVVTYWRVCENVYFVQGDEQQKLLLAPLLMPSSTGENPAQDLMLPSRSFSGFGRQKTEVEILPIPSTSEHHEIETPGSAPKAESNSTTLIGDIPLELQPEKRQTDDQQTDQQQLQPEQQQKPLDQNLQIQQQTVDQQQYSYYHINNNNNNNNNYNSNDDQQLQYSHHYYQNLVPQPQPQPQPNNIIATYPSTALFGQHYHNNNHAKYPQQNHYRAQMTQNSGGGVRSLRRVRSQMSAYDNGNFYHHPYAAQKPNQLEYGNGGSGEIRYDDQVGKHHAPFKPSHPVWASQYPVPWVYYVKSLMQMPPKSSYPHPPSYRADVNFNGYRKSRYMTQQAGAVVGAASNRIGHSPVAKFAAPSPRTKVVYIEYGGFKPKMVPSAQIAGDFGAEDASAGGYGAVTLEPVATEYARRQSDNRDDATAIVVEEVAAAPENRRRSTADEGDVTAASTDDVAARSTTAVTADPSTVVPAVTQQQQLQQSSIAASWKSVSRLYTHQSFPPTPRIPFRRLLILFQEKNENEKKSFFFHWKPFTDENYHYNYYNYYYY